MPAAAFLIVRVCESFDFPAGPLRVAFARARLGTSANLIVTLPGFDVRASWFVCVALALGETAAIAAQKTIEDSEADRVTNLIRGLFSHFVEHPEEIPDGVSDDVATRVTDWIAGMTDRYAFRVFEELNSPRTAR